MSTNSIFVFKKYALKKITAKGVIFLRTAVNVNDKYLITDYARLALIPTLKILRKRRNLFPEGTFEYMTSYRCLLTVIKVNIYAIDDLNKTNYSGSRSLPNLTKRYLPKA
jgi:hypothetical protein